MQAAVEVLDEIFNRHRPASIALADWGRAHRFAGSGDRSAIGTLVYDALRQRRSISWRMDADATRALVLGAAATALGLSPDEVDRAADGSRYALEPLSDMERAGLTRELGTDVAAPVRGDYPDWLHNAMTSTFGESAADEGAALAQRAPVDLRANSLKATPDKVQKALARTGVAKTPMSPVGLRIPPPAPGKRTPNVEADAAHGKGWFEIQDEGSQIASLLAGASARTQVLDLCAGAGGKTLALAAAMGNSGQIYAYDKDRQQLRPIFERLKRAGVRNTQVIDAGDEAALDALGPRFDIVLVDAPCTGSGTWRRRPDAKWRLKPANLEQRTSDQRAVLTRAASCVKPGGRIVYVTCSILPEENTSQIAWFLDTFEGYMLQCYKEAWHGAFNTAPPLSAGDTGKALLLTPAQQGTDGFFIAILQKAS